VIVTCHVIWRINYRANAVWQLWMF